jgi:hypothetical protein
VMFRTLCLFSLPFPPVFLSLLLAFTLGAKQLVVTFKKRTFFFFECGKEWISTGIRDRVELFIGLLVLEDPGKLLLSVSVFADLQSLCGDRASTWCPRSGL